MPRMIAAQVLASTRVDRRGEAFSREEIEGMFDRMSDPAIIGQHHDLRLPPIARALDKRLEERKGELCLIADIEVLDEKAAAAFEAGDRVRLGVGLVRERRQCLTLAAVLGLVAAAGGSGGGDARCVRRDKPAWRRR